MTPVVFDYHNRSGTPTVLGIEKLEKKKRKSKSRSPSKSKRKRRKRSPTPPSAYANPRR